MKTLYLLDYDGTLDTLEDPAAFIAKIRHRNPEDTVVVMSGCDPRALKERHPLLVADFWAKPVENFVERVQGLDPDRVIYVDDLDLALRVASRALRMVGIETEVYFPKDLKSLVDPQ